MHLFMTMPDHWQDSAKRLERLADIFSGDGMLLHNSSFFRIQEPGVQKDLLSETEIFPMP